MPAVCQLVYCTCPDYTLASSLARELIEKRLAACVNILPAHTSFYRWQGKIEEAREHLLLIKTTQANYPQLQTTIQASHPYTLPEIIAVDIQQGLPVYLQWIIDEARSA